MRRGEKPRFFSDEFCCLHARASPIDLSRCLMRQSVVLSTKTSPSSRPTNFLFQNTNNRFLISHMYMPKTQDERERASRKCFSQKIIYKGNETCYFLRVLMLVLRQSVSLRFRHVFSVHGKLVGRSRQATEDDDFNRQNNQIQIFFSLELIIFGQLFLLPNFRFVFPQID